MKWLRPCMSIDCTEDLLSSEIQSAFHLIRKSSVQSMLCPTITSIHEYSGLGNL